MTVLHDEQKCAYWHDEFVFGGYIIYPAHACAQPPSHHYETRNIVPPPRGSEWSSDREYYPDHEFVGDK